MTAATALGSVHAAVYTKLNTDATLKAMVTGIFDYVPEGTDYPYVVIGEATETPENSHDRFGRSQVITLHIWSNDRGFKKAQAIASRIHALLDHQALTVSGQNTISVRYEFSQTLIDPNPNLRHIPIRFRITTEQNPN